MPDRITEQIRRNAVALISLVVAISSLAYNTYRNELTEENRTIRQAGFEMISELSELQQVMLFARFGDGDERGNTTVGWSHILSIRDLSHAMPQNIQNNSNGLHQIWQEHNGRITQEDDSSYIAIDTQIDDLKLQILKVIKALE